MSSQDRDRDRGGFRRRQRRRGGPVGSSVRKEREYEVEPAPKPTIILAKPSHEQGSSSGSSSQTSSALGSKTPEKTVMLRNRGEEGQTSATNIPAAVSSGEITTPHSLQRNPTAAIFSSDSPNRLAPPPEMSRCVKLVDDTQMWNENAIENLVDQTDFFVVGVLGLQGTGKSTIMSLLAGNSPEDSNRQFVFHPQNQETREMCEHQTNGIDVFVTGERVIFLDTQPVMSASVLDRLIRHEKKIASEYTTAENCIEMQSLQQAAFLMSVCHIVLVVQDWFSDASFLRLLQTAEMLKPPCPSSNHDNSSNTDETSDYFPHIVFLQNRASRDDFSVETYNLMSKSLLEVFETSKLKFRGSVTMANSKLLPGLNSKTAAQDVNLFLIPNIDPVKENSRTNGDAVLTLLPEYRGYPSFTTLLNGLRQQIYSMTRDQLTHTTLSEKNWFHYAARMWEAVKKSQLMAEYNRLLN